MEYSNEIWQEERNYLKETLEMIEEQIVSSGEKVKNYKGNIIEAQKSMWEERSTQVDPTKEVDGAAIAWQHQSYMINEAKSMQFFSDMDNKLRRMKKAPYFARIDFDEKEFGEESFYIGMGKLAEDDFSNVQIYDWRSPVCSMFYNYEVGQASYECPAGIIEGNMTLKRQFKIANGIIEYMFDSGLKINDEVLQEILGKSTDDKMKTIVTSIQKEQDQLIRDESHQVLMIQGAAGSGKTSIALHRIAYILYRHRHNIDAKNMVIFSPNDLFNDYISDVLPELGEENVNLTTFSEYLVTFLDHSKVENWNSQMEHILSVDSEKNLARKAAIKFKSSEAFIRILKAYVSHLKSEGFGFTDIVYEGQVLMSAKDLKKLYRKNQEILSPKQSLNRIQLRLHKMLDPLIRAKKKALKDSYERSDEVMFDEEKEERLKQDVREAFSDTRSQINRITRFDVKWLYRNLFSFLWLQKKINHNKSICNKKMADYTVRHLDSGYLFYEDALAIAWLKGELEGVVDTSQIKHVVIDEAQDYSQLQYEIFNQLFPKATFTLLGDVNQSVNPYLRMGNYVDISHVFEDRSLARVTLQRSYRSSKEIASFCSALLPYEDKTIYLDRAGSAPRIRACIDDEEMFLKVIQSISSLQASGYHSIAVISKTEKSARWLFGHLENRTALSLISRSDSEYKQGTVVVPSYLAKGLEFDAVIVCCNSRSNYVEEDERNLFYTVCSRAMHELDIIYVDQKPVFLG